MAMAAYAEMPMGKLIDLDERGGVTTSRLVKTLAVGHADRVNALHEAGIAITFDIVQSSPQVGGHDDGGEAGPMELAHDRANFSYAKQLVQYGQQINAAPRHRIFGNDRSAAAYIQKQRHPLIPILPGQTLTGSQDMAEAAQLDPDNTANRNSLVPATAEAMRIVAEQMVGQPVATWAEHGYRVGLVGYGARTTKPLSEHIIMPAGVPIGVCLNGREQIEGIDHYTEELRACNIIFAAVPRACALKPRHVSEGTQIIDVGQGLHPETQEPAGSADEAVLAINGVCATLLKNSVGRTTTYVVYDRVLEMYETGQVQASAHLL